jgi:hypothetical protein
VESDDTTTTKDLVSINEIGSIGKDLETQKQINVEYTGTEPTDLNVESLNDLLEPVLAPTHIRAASVMQFHTCTPLNSSIVVTHKPNYNQTALAEFEAPSPPVCLRSLVIGVSLAESRHWNLDASYLCTNGIPNIDVGFAPPILRRETGKSKPSKLRLCISFDSSTSNLQTQQHAGP